MLRLIEGEPRGLMATAARGALSGLSLVYNAGLKVYLLPYRSGVRRRERLACPVISIGNLTVGGTGKTPITQTVCEILEDQGKRVCVLNRGYRGRHEGGAGIACRDSRDPNDPRGDGDEAVMLAQNLPSVPVIVGRDRRKTGRLALERFHPDVIVLDDGMQFYQLHRDLEVVLLDARRPFHNGWTLPRGLLREPLTHLRRAGCVIITHVDSAGQGEMLSLHKRIARLAPHAPIFCASYVATGLRRIDAPGREGTEWLRGRKIASLCALANPDGFEAGLVRLGSQVVHHFRFPDHHAPTPAELQTAAEAAVALGAEAMVVTEKDAVKIHTAHSRLPLLVLEARMLVEDEPRFAEVLIKAMASR